MADVVAKVWTLPVVGGRRYSKQPLTEPAFGSSGVNSSNQATSTTIILDLREDYSESSLLWLTTNQYLQRAPSYTHLPTGGLWGSGCARFVPGYFTGDTGDSMGQHVCGLGQILGFNSVVPGGVCRQFSFGQLFRYGAGYVSEQNGPKDAIFGRNGNAGGGGRPMIIPKWYDPLGENQFLDTVFAACDDEVCNCTDDPEDRMYGNDVPNPYDARDYSGIWQWMLFQVSLDGLLRVRIWTKDEALTHQGTLITAQDWADSGTAGDFPELDNINFVNSVENPTSECYKEMCYVKIQLGSDAEIPPPWQV